MLCHAYTPTQTLQWDELILLCHHAVKCSKLWSHILELQIHLTLDLWFNDTDITVCYMSLCIPDVMTIRKFFVADPFAQVCFLTQSMVTEKVQKTLCPTWDQTLIFGEIEIYGNPKNLESNPPDVYIELFDYDTFVSSLTGICEYYS